jgi:hypothetical protein
MHTLRNQIHRYRQFIVALCLAAGIVSSIILWGLRTDADPFAQRWLLYVVPLWMGVGLLSGWSHARKDILIHMAFVYLLAPFVATRIEACVLPITGAMPCMADLQQIRVMSTQLEHQVYYGTLVSLHVVGSLAVWYGIHRQEQQHVTSTGPSASRND